MTSLSKSLIRFLWLEPKEVDVCSVTVSETSQPRRQVTLQCVLHLHLRTLRLNRADQLVVKTAEPFGFVRNCS